MKSQKRNLLPWAVFLIYCVWMLLLLFDREQAEQSINLEPLRTIRLFVRVLLYDPSEYNIRLAVINLFGGDGRYQHVSRRHGQLAVHEDHIGSFPGFHRGA